MQGHALCQTKIHQHKPKDESSNLLFELTEKF